jgi:hypothetical protein
VLLQLQVRKEETIWHVFKHGLPPRTGTPSSFLQEWLPCALDVQPQTTQSCEEKCGAKCRRSNTKAHESKSEGLHSYYGDVSIMNKKKHNYAIKALTGLVAFGSTENRAQPHKQFADGGLIYAGKR